MAYEKKTWVDRQVEYPGRRKLTATGAPDVYDVAREEGLEIEAGDALNAANLNDLENRIAAEMDAKATATTYTATMTTSWAGNGPYTQTVAVAGLLDSDTPIVDVVLSTTAATARAQKEAWGMVDKITAADGSITVTCLDDKPAVAIQIQLKVVR